MDLTELCQYLRNWFERSKYFADFQIADGVCRFADGSDLPLLDGQYYRIVGSSMNDGVHQQGEFLPVDETFNGAVWLMFIPPAVRALAGEIDQWQKKYGAADSESMSPFSSESFGGYSYTKAQGYASVGGGMLTTWQAVYSARLSPWRKI